MRKTKPHNEHVSHTQGFSNLIIGKANSFAVRAAEKVVSGLVQKNTNPFVVVGPVGSGKTEILRSMAASISLLNDRRTVLNVTVKSMLDQYIDGLRESDVDTFRRRFSDVDVLIVDDADEIAKRTGFQEELLNILSDRMTKKRQTIFAFVTPIALLESSVNAKLLGRLSSGLEVRLRIPSISYRIKIVKQKLLQEGIDLPDAAISKIATLGSKNLWELNGKIHKVITTYELCGIRAVTGAALTGVLKD